MEANIFHLDLSLQEAKEFLKEEGYYAIGSQRRLNFERRIKRQLIKNRINCEFYYKANPKEGKPIQWIEHWRSFFTFQHTYTKNYSLNYGCILVSIDDTRYIISYGSSHQVIQKKANLSFGLDVAERIIDPTKIQIKNSAFINNIKSRTYTQFKEDSSLVPEIGESSNQIVGKIEVPFPDCLLYKFKKNIKFSTSIKISNKEISSEDTIRIVGEVHWISKLLDVKSPIPRTRIVKKGDPVISKLEYRIKKDISEDNFNKFTLHQLVNEGGEVRAPFSEGNLDLYYLKPYPLAEYTVGEVLRTIQQNGLYDITKVRVRNTAAGESYELLKLLDYTTEENSMTYCLFEGKWASFNESFLEYLDREIMKVNEISSLDEHYNLNETVLKEGTALMNAGDCYDKVSYQEYPYNIYMAKSKLLKLLDRKTEHEEFKEIEFADLYCPKKQKLIHVKIGGATEFRACIAQSQNSSRIFNTKSSVLNTYGISNVKTIQMLLITRLKNIIVDGKIDFSRSKSINFKLELVTWYKHVKDMDYAPEIVMAMDKTG